MSTRIAHIIYMNSIPDLHIGFYRIPNQIKVLSSTLKLYNKFQFLLNFSN